LLAAAAGILGFLKTPLWEIDAIIQPGIYLVQDAVGQNRETPISDPFRTAIQISQQSMNRLITSELDLDARRFPVLFAENLKTA
jgi:hypothetical protein